MYSERSIRALPVEQILANHSLLDVKPIMGHFVYPMHSSTFVLLSFYALHCTINHYKLLGIAMTWFSLSFTFPGVSGRGSYQIAQGLQGTSSTAFAHTVTPSLSHYRSYANVLYTPVNCHCTLQYSRLRGLYSSRLFQRHSHHMFLSTRHVKRLVESSSACHSTTK